MRAAVFQGIGKGHKIESVPEPSPGPDDVLIRVEQSGICATDLTITGQRKQASPLDAMFEILGRPGTILGHEFAGEIVAIGAGVERLKVGDRVAPGGMSGCGGCLTCLSGKPDWCAVGHAKMGGYAEYALAHENSCALVPKSLAVGDTALIEPLAVCLHAMNLAGTVAGKRVLIFGAGPMGLGLAHLARRFGASQVAVVARTNRHAALAGEMGCDAFLTQGDDLVTRVRDTLGSEADLVFETSGAGGAMDQAIGCAGRQGTILSLAMPALPDTIFHTSAMMKEIRIQYCFSYIIDELRVAAEILARGEVQFNRIVTRRVSFDEFPEAFESLRGGSPDCKVVLAV